MKLKEPAGKKAQIALELLLILTALAVIFVLLMPAFNDSKNIAFATANIKKQELAFNKIVYAIQEAYTLGNGNIIKTEIFVVVDSDIIVEKYKFRIIFSDGNYRRELEKELRFKINAKEGNMNLKKGEYEVSAESRGNEVRLSFAPIN